MSERSQGKRRRTPDAAEEDSELKKRHALYRSRKALRKNLSVIAAVFLLLFLVDRLFRSSVSPIVHFVLVTAGLGLIFFVNWLIEQQHPDPDPLETKRLHEALAMKAAADANDRSEKRAAKKAIDDAHRAERKRIDDAKRAEEKAIREAEHLQRNEQAANAAAVFREQQANVARENRITELMVMAETDTKKAIKLATREGIDLHAEAQRRVAQGSAALAFGIGAGVQAGVEIVKFIVDDKRSV